MSGSDVTFKNILSEGMNKIGVRSTEYTLVENPTVDDRLATDLKSGGSLKQERKTNFYQIFLYGFKPYQCVSGAQRKDRAIVHGLGKAQDGGTLTVSDGSRFPINVIQFNRDAERFHPTQKPVDLLRYLIRTYTNEGDTVLDNCIGSGTTAVACVKEKRRFIGFELNGDYYNIACKRVESERAQLTLF